MAKKTDVTCNMSIVLNSASGGAWLLHWSIGGADGLNFGAFEAYKNASAAKRRAKVIVNDYTPRKSIKWVPLEGNVDGVAKVVSFTGELKYKQDVDALEAIREGYLNK